MPRRRKSDLVAEYGDFQTPLPLARSVCALLARSGFRPAAIVEPTCGVGNFLVAALDEFPDATAAIGLDVNPAHVEAATAALQGRHDAARVCIQQGSFFDTDWQTRLKDVPDPLLVIGNPPWVTNTELGMMGSSNLPRKTNFKNHSGLDALTGKSNFDICEWMLLQVLHWLDGRNATLAVLCKTSVARKVLAFAWENDMELSHAAIHRIDAKTHFDASADACLLLCGFSPSRRSREVAVYESIAATEPGATAGYRDGHVVADIDAYRRWKHLEGEETYRWRSGVKHDCAKVMELRKEGNRFRNGLNELVELEEEYVFPMLKGSEVACGRTKKPRRWMLVTQQRTGEDTANIKESSPKTWEYLQSHADRLDRRASSIYKKRPRFSIFGVGDYSFAPWKVAVSGLYKKLRFHVVGHFSGKPIMLDDTCYGVPCDTESEAEYLADLLNSPPAREFLSTLIFWDTKRPIKIEILRRLDLVALARELGSDDRIREYIAVRTGGNATANISGQTQLGLFES